MQCLHRPPVLNGSFTMFCFRYPRNCSPLSVLESTILCHLLLTKSSRSVWSSSKYCSTWNTLFTRRKMPLTNRVRGPYRKLRTELFSFGFMAQALGARAIKNRIPWLTVWTEKNEVGKIFIISLDSIPAELSLLIDARQILSTRALVWFPTKTGHRVLKCPKSAKYNVFLRRKWVWMNEFGRCDRKKTQESFKQLVSNFWCFAAFWWKLPGESLSADWTRLKTLMKIEPMFVDAKKEGCGTTWCRGKRDMASFRSWTHLVGSTPKAAWFVLTALLLGNIFKNLPRTLSRAAATMFIT